MRHTGILGQPAVVQIQLDQGFRMFRDEGDGPVLERALELDLGIRVHVGQFADVGGAELAAELGAASADHLEHVGAGGAAALAEAGVAAVVLPIASFTLGNMLPSIGGLSPARRDLYKRLFDPDGSKPGIDIPFGIELLTIAQAFCGVILFILLSVGIRNRFRIK